MRARNIKPGFFKNELLAACGDTARLLFIGLWCLADREGKLEYRPARIKAELFPYTDVNIESLVLALGQAGFIRGYEKNGEKYILIPKFSEHQRPHHREKESVIPSPEPETTYEKPQIGYGTAPEIPVQAPEIPVEARLNPDSGYLNPSPFERDLKNPTQARPSPGLDSGLLEALTQVGLPWSIANTYVHDKTIDQGLLLAIVDYVRSRKDLHSPTGAIRSMVENPEDWCFEKTETGWTRRGSPPTSPPEKTDAERAAETKAAMQARREEAEQRKTAAEEGRKVRLLNKSHKEA